MIGIQSKHIGVWVFVAALLFSDVVLAVPPSEPETVEPWKPYDYGKGHHLPKSLIDQHRSPDGRYVAQLMYAKRGPTYYMVIIDHKLGHRFYLDKRLIIGEEYPFQQMRVYWKNGHTIIIRAKAADNSHYYFILYDIKTGELTQGKHMVERMPESPATLKPVSLTTLDERMMLSRQIPIGTSYEVLKAALPQLGPITSSTLRGHKQAVIEIEVFDNPVTVTFYFKGGKLNHIIYSITFKSEAETRAMHLKLREYYSQHFGPHKEDQAHADQTSGAYYSNWENDQVEAYIEHYFSFSTQRISWSLKFY